MYKSQLWYVLMKFLLMLWGSKGGKMSFLAESLAKQKDASE